MLQQMVRAVQAVIDARWIPEEYRGNSFFGHYDLWVYIDTPSTEPNHEECIHCQQFRSYVFTGDTLRRYFPDLTIETEDMIYPNVHLTLWGKDTCKCTLIRVTDNPDYRDPSKVVSYLGAKVEPYKPKKE
jgi:hypothetical protein